MSLLRRHFLTILFVAQSVPAMALNVIYNAATDVPVTAGSYTATGNTVDFALNFAPAAGTQLTVVRNTGLGFIVGTFSNLAQGQGVALSYAGVTYNFVANYYGGTGNDLVLHWADTKVVAWGFNDFGQLGNNNPMNSAVPVEVNGAGVLSGKTVIAVAAGVSHSLALCSDGTLAAWGLNSFGQLGNGSTTGSAVPVAVDQSGVALAGKTIIAVAAGYYYSLALCSDGTVAAWGHNDNGQLGNNSTTDSLVPVAVDQSGAALAGKTVIAISAGVSHSLALCSDGTAVAWGLNGKGQLGNNSFTSSSVPVPVNTDLGVSALSGKTVVALAAGAFHSLALCSDGTVAAWGFNFSGQLGDNSATDRAVPVTVNAATGVSALFGRTVTALSAGYDHSLARCDDGTVAAWGYNGFGQLGDNSTTDSLVPVSVNAATGISALFGRSVIAVSGGASHSLALCSDGTLAAWGDNQFGQLGDGTMTYRPAPVLASTASLAAGARFALGLSGPSANHSLGVVGFPPPPPTVTTLAATSVTATGAVLNGTVNAHGSTTTVSFDVGGSVAYGTNVPGAPPTVTGNSATAVSATLSGLTPGTTYHFRANGVSGAGATEGGDLTFTTPSNNASLSALALSAGTLAPAFASGTTSYTASVSHTTATVTVTPTTADSNATVTVNSQPVISGNASGSVSLVVGGNTLNILVIAEDGTPQNYSVVVTRQTAIQSWRQLHFGTTLNAGDAHDDADPNDNGIGNLVEYALDGDPAGGATGTTILPQSFRNGTDPLQLAFDRFLDRDDITLTVQAGDAPSGPWTDLARSVNGSSFTVLAAGATVGESGGGNSRQVTVGDLYSVTDPAHPRRFMRLQVVSNP